MRDEDGPAVEFLAIRGASFAAALQGASRRRPTDQNGTSSSVISGGSAGGSDAGGLSKEACSAGGPEVRSGIGDGAAPARSLSALEPNICIRLAMIS